MALDDSPLAYLPSPSSSRPESGDWTEPSKVKDVDPPSLISSTAAIETESDINMLSRIPSLVISSSEAGAQFQAPLSRSERFQVWKRRVQYVTLCLCFALEGWNDGSLGPLLPRIQSYYHVNYAVVSLLFIFACVGYIVGAILNVHLTETIGFGKVIVIGTLAQVVVYTIEIPAPPFPVFVFAYMIYGFGCALQGAQVNAFVAALNNPSKMAVLHASYGSGALLSPFVATQFSQMKHWSFHYFTALAFAVFTATLLMVVFKFRTQNEVLVDSGLPPCAVNTSGRNIYKQIWSQRVVHLLALFIFAYCGTEVTVGGWAVTYIIHQRKGGASSGYVSSGFFGGLMAGRLLLIPVTNWIGQRRAIFVYGALAICFEIFVWVVPSLIGDAVAISLVGLLLGPMFPIMVNQCSYFIPPWLLTGSIGWITSFGLLGTAVIPFMAGSLSNKYGVVSLQPLLVAMMIFMVGIWGYVNYDHWRMERRRLNGDIAMTKLTAEVNQDVKA